MVTLQAGTSKGTNRKQKLSPDVLPKKEARRETSVPSVPATASSDTVQRKTDSLKVKPIPLSKPANAYVKVEVESSKPMEEGACRRVTQLLRDPVSGQPSAIRSTSVIGTVSRVLAAESRASVDTGSLPTPVVQPPRPAISNPPDTVFDWRSNAFEAAHGLYCVKQDGQVRFVPEQFEILAGVDVPGYKGDPIPSIRRSRELVQGEPYNAAFHQVMADLVAQRPEPPCRYCRLPRGPCLLCFQRALHITRVPNDDDSALAQDLRRSAAAVEVPIAQLVYWHPSGPCRACPLKQELCRRCLDAALKSLRTAASEHEKATKMAKQSSTTQPSCSMSRAEPEVIDIDDDDYRFDGTHSWGNRMETEFGQTQEVSEEDPWVIRWEPMESLTDMSQEERVGPLSPVTVRSSTSSSSIPCSQVPPVSEQSDVEPDDPPARVAVMKPLVPSSGRKK